MLTDVIAGPIARLATESEPAGVPVPLGYIVLGVIAVPVVVLVLLAMFSEPKNRRTPLLLLACVGLLVGATIVGFAVGGFALSYFFRG